MRIEVRNSMIYFYDTWRVRHMFGRNGVVNATWNKPLKRWELDLNMDSVRTVNAIWPNSISEDAIEAAPKVGSAPLEIRYELPLYDHQKKSVRKGLRLKGFLDLSDPGTGKTRTQIELMLQRNRWPVLVICPKSIIHEVWEHQISEVAQGICVLTCSRGTAHATKQLNGLAFLATKDTPAVVVMNYELVPLVVDQLSKFNWGGMVLDESTKIKNHKAKRSDAIMALRDRATYRTAMTGTPAPNGYMDLFNQLRFVNPALFGENYYRYRQTWFYNVPETHIWVPRKEVKSTMNERMSKISIQHRKRECIDLPPEVDHFRSVEPSGKMWAAYKEMRRKSLVVLEDETVTAQFKMTQLMKLRQICSGFIYNEAGEAVWIGTPKHAAFLDILDDIGNNQVVIFADFTETIQNLQNELSDTAVSYYGGTPNRERLSALERFKSGDAQYMIANPASVAHGFNWGFCSYMVYYERGFNLEFFLQSRERIVRPEQTNSMTFYYLMMAQTIEAYIDKCLKAKKSLNDSIRIKKWKGVI